AASPGATSGAGSTSTTSSTGGTVARPTPTTSSRCAPPTTGWSTPASSASPATPAGRTGCGSTAGTAGPSSRRRPTRPHGARRPGTRPGPPASPTPPGRRPPANRSTRAGSPGTDRDGYRAAVLDIDWRGRVAVVRWLAVVDELEAGEGPRALVVAGEGRFFSSGLDLDALAADRDAARAVVDDVHRLCGRLLLFPAYTVGALNGHTFAAGAMLACCLDARVMREDRGYWCLPEADLGLPLTEAMFAAVTRSE